MKKMERYFEWINDNQMILQLVKMGCYKQENAENLVFSWRKIAAQLRCIHRPIAVRIHKGYTLWNHAAEISPYIKSARSYHSKDVEGKNDLPTKDALCFCIPQRVNYKSSWGKLRQQLTKIQQKECLPEHHLTRFGTAAEVSGLIQSYYNYTHECIPRNGNWVQTETKLDNGECISLGWRWFGELNITTGMISEEDAVGNSGCFLLGMEILETQAT